MAAAIQIQHDEQIVVFRLGEELYGLGIFLVNEIIRIRPITPIPGVESHIRGLLNLRGKTIPIVDLAERLNLTTQNESDSARIIVIESQHGNIGVIVNEVREVITLEADCIDEAPPMTMKLNTEFIRGVAKTNQGLITLIDMEKVLGE